MPTVLALLGWSFTPDFIRLLPALIFYPLVLISTLLGDVWSGFISTLGCLFYAMIFLRPLMVTNSTLEIPYLIRVFVFLFTSVLFLGLVGALQRALKKANSAIALRDEFFESCRS